MAIQMIVTDENVQSGKKQRQKKRAVRNPESALFVFSLFCFI